MRYLNNIEQSVIDALNLAWRDFCSLHAIHEDEQNDFRKCIHDAQRIIMARPFIENEKAKKKMNEAGKHYVPRS